MILEVLQFGAGLTLLFLGGEGLIGGATALVNHTKMTSTQIGLIVVAAGTSAPELAVSAYGALQGHGGLVIGNAIGSNICNLLFVYAVGLVFAQDTRINTNWVVVPDILALSIASIALLVCLLDGRIDRVEGAALLLSFIAYMLLSFRRGASDEIPAGQASTQHFIKIVGLVAGGMLFLSIGAHMLVSASLQTASWLGVSTGLVGLSIVAVGTSLPELTTTVVAAVRGQYELLVGSLLGSNLFNLMFVLGTSSIVKGLVSGGVGALDFLLLVLSPAVILLRTRIGGMGSIVLYAAYLIGRYTIVGDY